VDPSWTTEQRNAYTTARERARRQLLPWAVADTYAPLVRIVGRTCSTSRRKLFEWWTETPEYLKQFDQ